MKLGIVGLPNVGKSTLFNAITNAGAESANYPFCTIDPNVGIAPVPDKRLDVLAAKVCRVLALPKDSQPADSADFLRTVLNDYMYLKGRTGMKEV